MNKRIINVTYDMFFNDTEVQLTSTLLLNNNNNTTLDMEGYNWMVHNPHFNRAATSQSLTSEPSVIQSQSMPPPPPPAPLSIASDSIASSNSSETLASTSQPKKRGRRPDTEEVKAAKKRAIEAQKANRSKKS